MFFPVEFKSNCFDKEMSWKPKKLFKLSLSIEHPLCSPPNQRSFPLAVNIFCFLCKNVGIPGATQILGRGIWNILNIVWSRNGSQNCGYWLCDDIMPPLCGPLSPSLRQQSSALRPIWVSCSTTFFLNFQNQIAFVCHNILL